MSLDEPIMMMGIGGLFILIGLGAIIWGRREKKAYYDALSTRSDLREFMEHWPQRPGHGALELGGGIAIVVGVAIAIMGGVFWVLGN